MLRCGNSASISTCAETSVTRDSEQADNGMIGGHTDGRSEMTGVIESLRRKNGYYGNPLELLGRN